MKKLVFIFITHSLNNSFDKKFFKLISRYTYADSIVVNTANNILTYNNSINKLYEFTGYQKGIEIVARKSYSESKLQLIFLNDTIFKSHLKILSSYLIYKFINLNIDNCVVGLRQKTPFLIKQIVQHDYFFPTFIFSIILEKHNISKLHLFDKNFLNIDYLLKNSDFNNFNFILHIDNWLTPKSFFGGWYQSNILKPLSKEEYFRKKVTIFLEAKLQNILSHQKIATYFISDTSKYVRFLMFLDRIYTLILKLQFRIKNYLLKVVCG